MWYGVCKVVETFADLKLKKNAEWIVKGDFVPFQYYQNIALSRDEFLIEYLKFNGTFKRNFSQEVVNTWISWKKDSTD